MVKRRFKPLFAKTGVAPFNWHALRHFAVSCWIDAGLSPKTVQTFAGHSSLQVTMDRYGRGGLGNLDRGISGFSA